MNHFLLSPNAHKKYTKLFGNKSLLYVIKLKNVKNVPWLKLIKLYINKNNNNNNIPWSVKTILL